MIGKICPRGENLAGLIRYLYGPGRREEHTDPHVIAGYRDPTGLEPTLRPGGGRDFRRVTGRLSLPHDAMGSYRSAKPVWHCAMRAAPEDRLLSDQEWAQVARDVIHRTGLSPHGQDDDAVRWIAVRHAPDHIHIVAMLARQDGQRASTWNDRYRVRDACHAAEQRYGLQPTAPADRTADRSPTRAEKEKAARSGSSEPPRTSLRRQVATCAAAAATTDDFFTRLTQADIGVRLRYSMVNPGQVTGYSVSLVGDTTKDGTPVWYGGGKLAADLSWPRLSRRWTGPPGPDLTARERNDLWQHAADLTDDAADQIRAWSIASSGAAADAVYGTADALRVTAAALGSSVLRQAADELDRATRGRFGHIPPPTPVGTRLRHAAQMISVYAYITGNRTFTPLVLIIRLAALAETLAGLRHAQRRDHQADAALRAARHLHAYSQAAVTAGPPARYPAVSLPNRPPRQLGRVGSARTASPVPRSPPAGRPHSLAPTLPLVGRHGGHRHHAHAVPLAS